jgi:hypothetical protein
MATAVQFNPSTFAVGFNPVTKAVMMAVSGELPGDWCLYCAEVTPNIIHAAFTGVLLCLAGCNSFPYTSVKYLWGNDPNLPTTWALTRDYYTPCLWRSGSNSPSIIARWYYASAICEGEYEEQETGYEIQVTKQMDGHVKVEMVSFAGRRLFLAEETTGLPKCLELDNLPNSHVSCGANNDGYSGTVEILEI